MTDCTYLKWGGWELSKSPKAAVHFLWLPLANEQCTVCTLSICGMQLCMNLYTKQNCILCLLIADLAGYVFSFCDAGVDDEHLHVMFFKFTEQPTVSNCCSAINENLIGLFP